jgi:signal recognition particle receptor subunit beta
MPDSVHVRGTDTATRHTTIVFAGATGSGKSAAIASLSEFRPVQIDEITPDTGASGAAPGAAVHDYGALVLAGGKRIIHLYAMPARERFHFMWDVLADGGVGLILLVDNSSTDPFGNLHTCLDEFSYFISRTRTMVGVTHCDRAAQPTQFEYCDELQRLGHGDIPALATDPRRRYDASRLLRHMLEIVDPDLADLPGEIEPA